MTIDYLERVILDIAQIYEAARGTPDEFSKESKFQFLGAYLRMLKDSIEFSQEMRAFKPEMPKGA